MYRFNRAASASVLALSALFVITMSFVTGCGSSTPPSDKSLYERLGGHEAVVAVIDDFVGRAAADPAVNFTRKGHPNQWDATPDNVAKLKKHLVQFVEKATGGPATYEGRDMLSVHTGMQITEAEWNAIVADLKATLDKFKVPEKEQGELIAIVATTHDQIVGH
jgi:hemoglobin